ncbi:DUF6159 family protein [Haloarchaeobius iranensis]|uniref:Glycerophosphoryl diester phosphodiesterase membrane domain-containing protein n=1 Tax=Haloarchaeobius iranensis TaxID=996166 RepID=A0A1G9WF35_9EURY|nr:DUF6159 family protein [Haloarchaeobius iranensis]SDM82645.1 hypothetical protein SAMN05192554_10815 [Haloarchaeobius iranensis]
MGFLTRLKTGWALTKDSLRVLRGDPELAVFPLVGGVAGLAYMALLFGGSSLAGVFATDVGLYATLFLLYLGTTFVASFTTAALVHETRTAFEGGDPSFRSGMAAAWRNKGTLLAWSVVSATVGVIIQLIDSQDNLVAEILASIVSVAWSILTYFVVPVIAFEDVSVVEAIRRSGDTFKQTWGETAGAHFGVGIVTFLLMLPVVLVAALLVVGGVASGSGVGVGLTLAVVAGLFVCMYLFSTTLSSIAKTALYVYATEGRRPGAFEDVDFGHVPE